MSQIKSRARYVDPPPKPTLEYNIDVIKNNIDSEIINKYLIIYYESKYSTINCNRHKNHRK